MQRKSSNSSTSRKKLSKKPKVPSIAPPHCIRTKEKYKLEFELPGLPKRPNQLLRKHRGIVAAERNKWHDQVYKITGYFTPKTPLKYATLSLVRYSSSCPDPDGLVSSFKYVLDALVKIGILEDDKYTNIGMPKYSWSKVSPKCGKIRVTIESEL